MTPRTLSKIAASIRASEKREEHNRRMIELASKHPRLLLAVKNGKLVEIKIKE